VQGNLFILPVDEEGKWVRYHHLFQDFLQRLVAKEHPQETSQILHRLAVVYEEREEWEKAYCQYQQLGDVEATADLIRKAGLSMIAAGRDGVLAEWIDALPVEVVSSQPHLLSLRGAAAVDLGEAETGLRFFNQAEAGCRVSDDLNCLAHTLARRANAHRFVGDYQASLADVESALELVGQDAELLPVQAAAFRVKGVVLSRMGQPHDAIGYLERAEQLNAAMGNLASVALVQLDLGIAFRTIGRYEEAESAYNRSLSYWRETSDLRRQSSTLNNLAVLYHYTRKYEQAAALLEEAVECARQSGERRMMTWVLTSIGDLYADLEAFESAWNAYSHAAVLVEHMDDTFLRLYLSVAQAALARLQGDRSKAHEYLQKAEKYAQASESGYEQRLFHQEAGRLALAEGRYPEAVTHFVSLTDTYDGVAQPVEAACADLRLAVALDAAGDEESSRATLARALVAIAGSEVWHPLVIATRDAHTLLLSVQSDPDIGQQSSRLLRHVTRYESERPRLRRRLRLRATAVPLAPPRLVIRALGSAQVQVDERLITSSDWQSWAARDLLFLLLARPEGLTREDVGAIFWPESSPARLKLSFKKTIYRLRRALELDAILFDEEQGLYRFNHQLDYNYDVDEFRVKLAQAKAESSLEAVIASFREAIDLYQGPYLPQVDGAWILEEQEALRRAYEEAVLKLASLYLEVSEYRETLTCCRLLLKGDPCQEEAHRQAMRAHAALGNRAAVSRQFEECKAALQNEFAVEPSPETLALFQTLIHRRPLPHLPGGHSQTNPE
jgi:DNA-binding SARP family transcriptional activator